MTECAPGSCTEQRPLAECLPHINANDLQIPRDYKTYTAPWISLRFPFISAAPLFAVVDANGDSRPDIFSTFSGGGGGPEQHYLQVQIVAPGVPRNLRALGRRDGIHLKWIGVGGATSYEVWRAAGAAARRIVDTTLAPRYDDRRTRPHVAYTYFVKARNDAGAGGPSHAVRATRP